MTSGVRRTVRPMWASSSGEKWSRRPGPRRASLEMSRRGRPSRELTRRFGTAGTPTGAVRFDQTLGMVSQRLADLEDGPELVMADAADASTLVGCPSDLVQVAPDRSQLADATLKRYELLFWQRG